MPGQGDEVAQGSGQLDTVPDFAIGFSLGAAAFLVGIGLVFDLKVTRSFMHPGLTRRQYFRENPSSRIVWLVVGTLFLFAGTVVLLSLLAVAVDALVG